MRVYALLVLVVCGCDGNQVFQVTDGSSQGKSSSLDCSYNDAAEAVGVNASLSSGHYEARSPRT